MDIGLYFPLQLPRPWGPGAERTLVHEALEQVELADRLGFTHAWVPEQHFLEEYSHSSAPEVFLAAAAARTRGIRLGHGVVLLPPAYNAPTRVAERIAMLDLVSDGRVEFGFGDSKSRIELEGFGIEADERQAMTAEAAEQVAAMLALEPYPGHRGRWFSASARNVVPKPVQRPHPPLWMACSSDEAVRTAARHGVGALAHGFRDPDEARRVVGLYRRTFAEECRPIGFAVNPRVATLEPFYCHPDPDVAWRRGSEAMESLTFAVRHYYTFGRHHPGRTDLSARRERTQAEMRAEAGAESGAESAGVHGGHSVGTPDRVAAHLAELRDTGVDQVILAHQAGRTPHAQICASLELFADQVLPRLGAGPEPAGVPAHVTEALARRAAAAPAAVEPVDAYGRDRPPVDPSAFPPEVRAQFVQLNRVAELGRAFDAPDLP
ncbi:LLM class flavin-dependent oxidoreductase [Pseudonocardia sp. GCM10023141]|uniref:LLM class flavin-dependent oxidoreductase n=1 Tax=Pseudonocardia sp. GCM10023141 TaxID=3252653 RepID=UPI003612FE42